MKGSDEKRNVLIIFVKIDKVPDILCFESVITNHVKQLSSWGLVMANNEGHETNDHDGR